MDDITTIIHQAQSDVNVAITLGAAVYYGYIDVDADDLLEVYYRLWKWKKRLAEKCPENLSEKDMLIVKDKEGKKILSKVKNNSYVIALAIDGKNLSSEELADTISKLAVRGNSHITFVIGGSLGLSDEVLKRADYKLSFSKMTFPHQLMRLILLEQVYRAFRINNNEPYHK